MTHENPAPAFLTEEQQRIVAHDFGPALVFAVAGAGKTTAMVHRIERLVRAQVFAPHMILATSFSKASVQDIKAALAPWPHCARVQASTLHSVGLGLVRIAQRRGHLQAVELGREEGEGESRLLARTLSRAWQEKTDYASELDALDRQDFLTYVGVCKANLRYADLERANLPAAGRLAQQAAAPAGFPWYLDLYRLYEDVRRQENALTFDDMLLSGWECLVRYPDVLAEARARWQCVLVDEFQDVNLVQSEILDLLTDGHRNYMAIGDDDQTIYEWRGADPGFILRFRERYGAARYFIRDNFRSKAAHLSLANRVIEKNRRRQPKRLSLTQGFDGDASVHREDSAESQGRHIAELIQESLRQGRAPGEIAVLVRLYAQTPFIEHALAEAGLPYQVVGSRPFYQRAEVTTLLDYLAVARLERQHSESLEDFAAKWGRIANVPNRYLPRAVSEAICHAVTGQALRPTEAIARAAADAPPWLASSLGKLAASLGWLADALDTLPADRALTLLDEKIGYQDWLRRSSGFAETGAARAGGVAAFLQYAAGKGTAAQFLAHLETMAAGHAGLAQGDTSEAIRLLTVFRAKGLQWPVVFVPDCNQGTFPYGGPDELEEERRLFYVALTRPKTDLHLHTVKTEPLSQFLAEADWEWTLAAVREVKSALARDPACWRTPEALALARHTPALHLERFFQTWWDAPPAHARGAAHRIQGLFAAARRLGLWEALGMQDTHLSVWEHFGRSPEWGEDEFPELSQFVPRPAADQADTAGSGVVDLKPAERGFQVGDTVRHALHGLGSVLEIKKTFGTPQVKIQFAKGGPVLLPAKFVQPLTAETP